MALVESHDCNWEASGCARRSFLVCFWYDFSAAWKTVWKGDPEEADVVAVAGADMAREGGNVLKAKAQSPPHRLSLSGSCVHGPASKPASQNVGERQWRSIDAQPASHGIRHVTQPTSSRTA